MIIEIRIPSPGESIAEVEVASWLVNDGDYVEKDQEIAEIESDKATLPLLAEESGIIKIVAETGKTTEVGSVACTIDTRTESGKPGKNKKAQKQELSKKDSVKEPGPSKKDSVKEPDNKDNTSNADNYDSDVPGSDTAGTDEKGSDDTNTDKTVTDTSGTDETGSNDGGTDYNLKTNTGNDSSDKIIISPLAKKHMEEKGLSVKDILTGLRRITKEDVDLVAGLKEDEPSKKEDKEIISRNTGRQRMSMLRRKLSQRLIAVKNETAMLTTFNEVDMSRIIDIRKTYQSAFTEKHGVKLGFMSFFTKAATEALKTYPNVNSYIEVEDIITPEYCDIGIAMQTDKGLMVPVIRNAESLSLASIEKAILELAEKAKNNRISIDDMTGGTFTITNGGVFGSLLSTPILNPPQSGILGMHNIVDRPVAVKGKVEIRPMMYIALSYDHRIIDGRDSVSYLLKVKEMIEDPFKMLFQGNDPANMLLNL